MMDKDFVIEQLNTDVKNWQDSSEAYRSDYEQMQIMFRSVIEAYDSGGDLNGAIEIARHLLSLDEGMTK
jgi:hypothetical protein